MAPQRDDEPHFELLSGEAGSPSTAAERRYGGTLRFPARPAPRVIANFVSSLDGVVSLGLRDGTDSSVISGHHAGDRFVMAMLRSAADAVMIGAGTLRATAGHQWVAEGVSPENREAMAEYRAALGRPAGAAPLVVITGSGHLPSHPALAQPEAEVLVVTTEHGRELVHAAYPKLRAVAAGSGELLGAAIVDTVHRELGAQLILTEGGPSLLGALLRSRSVHELFLTVSPVLAGRDPAHPRLPLVFDFVAPPHDLRHASLLSARRSGDHLLLRYGLTA